MGLARSRGRSMRDGGRRSDVDLFPIVDILDGNPGIAFDYADQRLALSTVPGSEYLGSISGLPGTTFDRDSVGAVLDGESYTSFAADAPRFGYDALYALGLLIEEDATNVLWYSNGASAGWPGAFVSPTSGQPDIFGGNSATKYTNSGGAGPVIVQNRGTLTGSAETFYVILENSTALVSSIFVTDTTSSATILQVLFTWSTGVASLAAGAGTFGAVKIADAGPNGGAVYLIWMTYTGVSGHNRRANIRPAGNTTSTLSAIVQHAQLEERAYFTSPIVTAGAAASRDDDDYTRTVEDGAFSKLLWGKTPAYTGGTNVLWQRDDGTESNRVRLVRLSDRHLHYIVTAGGAEQVNIDLGEIANDTFFIVAIRAAQDDFAVSLNNGAVINDASGTLPSGLTTERVGRDTSGNYWNAFIQQEVTFA